MTLMQVGLDDKYRFEAKRIYLSGVQALVRLPMLQRERDARRPEHRRLHLRLPRLAARRLRPGAVGAQSTSRRTTSSSSRASTRSSRRPRCGARSSSTSFRGAKVRRRVRHLVRQGARRRPLAPMRSSTPTWPAPRARRRDRASPATTTARRARPLAHQSDQIFRPAACRCSFPRACRNPRSGPAWVRAEPLLGLLDRHEDDRRRWSRVRRRSPSIRDRVDIVLPTDFEMPPGGLHIRWPDPPLEAGSALMDSSGRRRWPTCAPIDSTTT